jgi:hypothetical protein
MIQEANDNQWGGKHHIGNGDVIGVNDTDVF